MRRPWIVALGAVLACAPFLAVASAAGDKDEQKEEKVVRELKLVMGGGGHLGVALAEVDAKAVERLKLSEERGALVREVNPDSPAAKAGVEVDDVIVRYQGDAIEGVSGLVRRVRETPPGRKVTLEVIRKGATQKLSATLDERPWDVGGIHEGPDFDVKIPHVKIPKVEIPHIEMPDLPDMPNMPDMPELPALPNMRDCPWSWEGHWTHAPRRLGIQYQEVSGQLAAFFKLKDERGVLVTNVEPDGPAAKAGLKAGDVIVKVDGEQIRSGRDLRHEIADVGAGDEVAVTVLRDGRALEVKVTAGGQRPMRRHPQSTAPNAPAAPEQPKAPKPPQSDNVEKKSL